MVFNEAVCCVYEAKRMSEKNTGVGPETEIFILHRNVFKKVTKEGLAYLDEQYRGPRWQEIKRMHELEMELSNEYDMLIDQSYKRFLGHLQRPDTSKKLTRGYEPTMEFGYGYRGD
jgi:hypothetical protein